MGKNQKKKEAQRNNSIQENCEINTSDEVMIIDVSKHSTTGTPLFLVIKYEEASEDCDEESPGIDFSLNCRHDDHCINDFTFSILCSDDDNELKDISLLVKSQDSHYVEKLDSRLMAREA